MTWVIVFDKKAQKELSKLDREVQRRIIAELDNIVTLDNPKLFGKALTGSLAGLWRYRIANYRIVCHIHEEKFQVLIIKIAHRKEVYK